MGELDSLIGAATANGVSGYIFTFGNPPTWALNPDGSVNQGDADEVLSNLVRRECGTIQYYETWNEANLPSSWTGTQTQLITLAQHFYQTVKANCPDPTVYARIVRSLSSPAAHQHASAEKRQTSNVRTTYRGPSTEILHRPEPQKPVRRLRESTKTTVAPSFAKQFALS